MYTERWLASQLRAHGLATEAQIEAAAARDPGTFCRNLLRAGVLRETDLLRFLGNHFQTRYVSTRSIRQANIPRWVLDLLPADLCEQLRVLPIRCDRNLVLSIVTPDPSDTRVREVVRQTSKVKVVRAYVALPDAVSAGIRKWYRGDEGAFEAIGGAGASPASRAPSSSVSPLPGASRPDASRSRSAVGPLPEAPPRPPAALAPRSLEGPVPLPDASPQATLSLSGLAPDALVAALITFLEREEGWRQGHGCAVAAIAERMGRRAGLSTGDLAHLRLAALVHDLGKPGDPHLTAIALDEDPRLAPIAARVHRVPVDLLHGAGLPDPVAAILLALHERPDGRGVPRGLEGDAIPRPTRMLQVADAACHLLSNPLAPAERAAREEACLAALRACASRGALDPGEVERLAAVFADAAGEARRPWDRPRVLIVDQEIEAALPLAMALVQRGFYAGAVATTAEAAREVLTREVDLILLEVDLRPVDGLTFFEQLRGDPRTSRIPAIVVAYGREPTEVERARELGALSFVAKPYDLGHLVGVVEGVFSGRPSRRRRPAVSASPGAVALDNIVETLSASGRTGAIRLGGGNGAGEIYLQEGEIVHGRYGELTGEEAVIEMLSLDKNALGGEFTFDPTPTVPARTIDRETQALLSAARARRAEGGR